MEKTSRCLVMFQKQLEIDLESFEWEFSPVRYYLPVCPVLYHNVSVMFMLFQTQYHLTVNSPCKRVSKLQTGVHTIVSRALLFYLVYCDEYDRPLFKYFVCFSLVNFPKPSKNPGPTRIILILIGQESQPYIPRHLPKFKSLETRLGGASRRLRNCQIKRHLPFACKIS